MTLSGAANNDMRVLQRVIFPGEDLDLVPLYVETNMERGAAELASEMAAEAMTGLKNTVSVPIANAAVGEAQSSIRFGVDVPRYLAEEVGPRRSAVINEGRRVSFATYFNAFPASYWRRWTTVEAVTLRMRLAGESKIILYRSTARGFSHPVETISVHSDEPETVERTLPLDPFIDGGWYWFDIVAGPRGTTLIEADWLAPAPAAKTGRISIGITTFNRPEYLLDQMLTLAEATELLPLLDRIYVIDQGSNRAVVQPGFADATKKLGDMLQVIEQGNLGGAGGFARSMNETVQAGRSDYVLIMDDDVKFDPEGIVRMATFADFARKPTIVGGHMFSLHDRSLLHAYAEAVEPWTWWWGFAPNTKPKHDFGRRNLRNTPWLHRRADSDYNGWWTCLIPVKVIADIGLALPVFIKWDDAEYGVRARDRGYPTVALPGSAAWQVPWDDKDDARDWQAYYHHRNRIVSALLHSPHPKSGGLVSELIERQLQSLLSMQYSTVALRLLAVEDVLSGPDHMHREIGTKMKQLRELQARYPDAHEEADLESFPPPRRKAPDSLKHNTTPTNKINLMTKAAAGTIRQFRAVRPGARQRPQVALPYQDASWWVLAKMDSVLISSAEGTSAAWFKRDRGLFRALGWRSLVVHRRLRKRWAKLAEEYRAAAADFNSPQRWNETWAASVRGPSDKP